jgi:anaerobic selenocysteine-containing dehydrogenase
MDGISCAVQHLRDARRRGMKIIAIDPRRTELARSADLHLQVRPGEDPTLLAGMVRVILDEVPRQSAIPVNVRALDARELAAVAAG